MSRHVKEKRIFMVEKFHQFQSSLKVIDAWKQEFPDEKPPTAKTILYQVKKFKIYGSIAELPRVHLKTKPEREEAKNRST